ncbi:MAG TPA: excalibur calcium-binding domain-containing protein [Jatrophihabitans sp.]|jgi:hypothetical protein|uniref:hypothetical protein n=1 Tax=Jatrophihabitans sp. TaxID=1932789 RepID=UPI002EF14DC1
MARVKIIITVLASVAAVLAFASPASADTVSMQGISQGSYGNSAAAGTVRYQVAVEVAKDPAGAIVNVRGVGTVQKWANAAKVQVDMVRLGTDTTAVLTNSTPVNSGSATFASSRTGWRAVAPRTCVKYHVRANFSVRWMNGSLSRFSILSPLTAVCGPSNPPVYANCDSLNRTFPHGVGRSGAVDQVRGSTQPVTSFYVSSWIYSGNTARDADKDGIACERL